MKSNVFGIFLILGVILMFSTSVLAVKHQTENKDNKHHELDENDNEGCQADDTNDVNEHNNVEVDHRDGIDEQNDVEADDDDCASTPPPPPS